MKGQGLFSPCGGEQTYMKLTMSRMVEMLFCPAPAACSPSLMYWAPGKQTSFHLATHGQSQCGGGTISQTLKLGSSYASITAELISLKGQRLSITGRPMGRENISRMALT